MNTAAAFQLRDSEGKPAGFSSASKGDEVEIPDADAAKFIKLGYASAIKPGGNDRARS